MNFLAACGFRVDGFLTQVIVLAVPIAFLLAWGVLTAYRFAVRRSMREQGGGHGELIAPSNGASRAPPENPVRLALVDSLADRPTREPSVCQEAAIRLNRTARAQCIAGLALALLLTLLYFVFIDVPPSPVRLAAVWLVYAWPVVPAMMLILAPDRRTRLRLVAGYFLLLAIVDLGLDSLPGIRDTTRFGDLFVMWGVIMGAPTLILFILSNRAIRSVGLLAFLFTTACVAGYLLSFQAAGCWIINRRALALVSWLPIFRVVVAILMVWLAWRTTLAIARAWERKRLSDQSLTLDSWWLTTTFAIAVFNSGRAGVWTLLFILSWLAYRWVVVRAGSQTPLSGRPKELLLLRVFGFDRRSRALLDGVGQRWRAIGPINMIAGTDLASACFDPGEIIQFLRGRLREAYIRNPAELEERVAALDVAPDPDGRFRINEFFCHDDTWRSTVKALAQRADTVLMDLRGFGPNNAGCEFELGLLVDEVPLERVVLLVDVDTHLPHLEQVIATLPRRPVADSAKAEARTGDRIAVLRLSSPDAAATVFPALV